MYFSMGEITSVMKTLANSIFKLSKEQSNISVQIE
jgi:hypothetical protein